MVKKPGVYKQGSVGFDAELPDGMSPHQLATSLESDTVYIAKLKAAVVAGLVLSNPAVTAADVNILGIKAKPGTDPVEMEVVYEVRTEDETAAANTLPNTPIAVEAFQNQFLQSMSSSSKVNIVGRAVLAG